MQSVSSRIWTRIAVFISYDDNNYTTGTSIIVVFITNISTHESFWLIIQIVKNVQNA